MMAPDTVALLVFLFLVAPFFASFMMVAVYRLPIIIENEALHDGVSMTLSNPSSHCEVCGRSLTWLELIPIVSWCLQKGTCRGCGTSYGVTHVLVELASLGLAGLAVWLVGPTWLALAVLVFLLALLALALIDIKHYLAPDAITLPMLWLGLLLSAFHVTPLSLFDATLGAVAGYLAFWLPSVVYSMRHNGDIGMGLGDAKMLAMVGAWMGFMAIPYVVLAACLVGLLYGFWLRTRGVMHVPFAPAIAAGALFVEVYHVF